MYMIREFANLINRETPFKKIFIDTPLLNWLNDYQHYLVLVIVSPITFQINSLRELLHKTLRTFNQKFYVSEFTTDTFLIKFQSHSDSEFITEPSPRIIRDDLLSLERCAPNKFPHKYLFDNVEFGFNSTVYWLTTTKFFIQRLIIFAGSHRSITFQESRNWGKFARVRLPVDIKQSLRDSITFPISSLLKITAKVGYERLPRFC